MEFATSHCPLPVFGIRWCPIRRLTYFSLHFRFRPGNLALRSVCFFPGVCPSDVRGGGGIFPWTVATSIASIYITPGERRRLVARRAWQFPVSKLLAKFVFVVRAEALLSLDGPPLVARVDLLYMTPG